MIRLLKRRPILPTRPAFYCTSRRALDKAVPPSGGSASAISRSSSPNDPVELLYKMSQKSTVLVMLGVTGVSAMVSLALSSLSSACPHCCPALPRLAVLDQHHRQFLPLRR